MRCSLNSLDNFSKNRIRLPLWDKASAEFCFAKSRELLTKPFPSPRVPYNSCRDLNDSSNNIHNNYSHIENHMQDLSLGQTLYTPLDYRDRTLTKSESMSRKTYTSELKRRLSHNRAFYRDPLSPPRISYPMTHNRLYFNDRQTHLYQTNGYREVFTPEINYDDVFVYDNHSYVEEPRGILENSADLTNNRPRTLSFNSQENLPKKCGKTVRERNLRRQSYNPQAYADTSSSDSDCMSLGSVDLDWRRRRRLRRMSTSNSSIRSELGIHGRVGVQFLKPEMLAANIGKGGRSPPPSNSMLSGLSPTTAARKRQSDSSSGSST